MRSLSDILSDIPKVRNPDIPWDVERQKWELVTQLSARCLFDFPFFCRHVLGIKNLAQFHMEPIELLNSNKFVLIIWPRGHLKTTLWSEAYVIWRLWKETGIEIAIVSSALEQSQKIMENIQMRIEDNEFLQQLIPKDRQDTWNKSQLNTENRNRCYQKPFNSTARGIHVDYLIMDDILREENLSQEQIKDYFWSIFYPTVQTRKGQILMVGTPMTTKDLFSDLSKMEDVKYVKRAAVEVDEQGKWLKPIWAENFTLEQLNKIQELQSSIRFEREYMCNPLGGGASIFGNIRVGKHKETTKAIAGEDYFMGVDIAMASGGQRDFSAFSIIGVDYETGFMKQRRLERYKGWNEDQIIKRVEFLHTKFNFRKVWIEKIGLSMGLVDKLEKEKTVPVEGFLTNRVGKEEMISSIAVAFETEVLEVLDNTIQYNELIGFKAKEDTRSGKMTYEGVGEHDDTVIALGLAVMAANSEQRGGASITLI